MVLKSAIRSEDYIGRLGGEEFAIIVPRADGAVAYEIGERLRQRVMDAWLPTLGGEIRLTVSVGVATLIPQDARVDDLLRRSDEALYAAKTGGRNRLVCDNCAPGLVPLRQTATP